MKTLDLRKKEVESPRRGSTTNVLLVIAWVVLVLAGIGYLVWLDQGCALSGVMTWAGKVCIQ